MGGAVMKVLAPLMVAFGLFGVFVYANDMSAVAAASFGCGAGIWFCVSMEAWGGS
jgi:hypothetical protein